MEYAPTHTRPVRRSILRAPARAGTALVTGVARAGRWLASAGHKDRPCSRCGTIVRAGQRQCVLCSYNFDF